MESMVPVRDIMTREFVGVSESDSIVSVASVLTEEDTQAAVVLRGGTPVGMLTAEDVLSLVAEEADPASATVSDVMSPTVVTIPPDQALPQAIEAISARGVRRMVVVEDDEAIGILSEGDLLTAAVTLPAVEDQLMPGESFETGPTEEVVGESPARTDREFDEQGVCEVCGTLTRSLTEVNGQLVCGDCQAI
ncbi:MAG: CBS domain-containing protein [Halobacteriales archaeon]|nr:CBS domain-containing protein [Halobacteriales archaeon]